MRILLFFLGFSLSGCGYLHKSFGRQDGFTTIQLKANHNQTNARTSMAQMDLGVLVYAVNVGNPSIRGAYKLDSEYDSANWSIPNGTYHFYAWGYGTSASLKCGDGGTYLLNGIVKSVTISISSNCTIPGLQSSTSINTMTGLPKPLYIAACASTEQIASLTGGSCSSSATTIHSAQVSLPAFAAFDGNIDINSIKSSISGPCVVLTAGALTSSGPFSFPLGDGTADSPILSGVNAFGTTDCTGAHIIYGFPHSIAAANIFPQNFFLNDGVSQFPTPLFPAQGYPWAAYIFSTNPNLYLREGL